MTLQDKANEAKCKSIGRTYYDPITNRTYTYGDNPYFDQFITSECAHELFPETFPPVEYYWKGYKKTEKPQLAGRS
jgi:hypothetical protein